jgi:transcriptional regulator with XRE-family HTH domain
MPGRRYGRSAIDLRTRTVKAPCVEPLEAFAANVRRLRQERNLTQEALAHKADLNLTDIARVETLKRDPGVKVIAKIAYGLGVPTAALFEGVKHEP